jgi:hypothetical protein
MFIFWWLLAKLVSIPAVTNYLINRARRTPYTPILSPDGTQIYMERLWLLNPYYTHEEKEAFAEAGLPVPWKFPISVRAHCIRTPDLDRADHDHPWNAISCIMRGGYLEKRNGHIRLIDAGQVSRLRYGKDFHSISQVYPEPGELGVWTLFITFKFQGTWGYLVDGKKVPFKDYLRNTGDANYKESKGEKNAS